MELVIKQAMEFGQRVALYRCVDTATGKSTLWHSSLDKALGHYERLTAPKEGQ